MEISSPIARRLPLELVGKILLYRPVHPLAKIIKKSFVVIHWYSLINRDFSGNGEPLLCKDYKELNIFVKRCQNLNKEYKNRINHTIKYIDGKKI
tara:strand:- start:90 stop:374 length:285 start_codon:yes stop_codon:yes gene_type:complete